MLRIESDKFIQKKYMKLMRWKINNLSSIDAMRVCFWAAKIAKIHYTLFGVLPAILAGTAVASVIPAKRMG